MRKILSLLMMTVFCASMFADTFTVAGSSAAVFGTAWDPENTANDMTLVDGLYTLVKEDVTLAAGTLEYKVCQDHAWTTCWPTGPNATLAIAESAKYTLTFTFDAATKTVNASALKTEDAQVDPKASIKGSWDGWANALDFTLSADKKSATLVANFTAETYEFKVIVGDGDWRSDEHVFTRTDASTTDMTWNSNINLKLVADVAGDYTFKWIFASNTLEITFPEKGDDPEPPTPPVVSSYTIVGDSTLVGSNWDSEDTANDMVYDAQEGLYKLVKTNVTLAPTYYLYKVVFNHDWTVGEFPESGYNYVVLIEEAGVYTITFTYDPEYYNLTATAVKTGDMPKDVTLYFVNKENWDSVFAYFWVDETNINYAAWPGEKMTLTNKVLHDAVKDVDYTVYSYSFPSMFTKVIFNNGQGGEGNQTSDMSWSASKPYYYDLLWYESLEAINPAAETKFYITGDYNITGAGNQWDPKAFKSLEDSYTFDLKAGTYQIAINLDGTSETWKGYDDLTVKTPGLAKGINGSIIFRLLEPGQVVVTYKVVDETVTFTVTGSFYSVGDGYYLAGFGAWYAVQMDEYRKFTEMESNPGIYTLNTQFNLYEGDEIQAIKVKDNEVEQWYADTYYTVDANHAGIKDIYFSPVYKEAWAEFGGYIYIAPNNPTAIENANADLKAVKMIKNGQLVIIKNGVQYNAMGIRF